MLEQGTTNHNDHDKGAKVNAVVNTWKSLWQGAVSMEFKKGQVLFYRGHLPYGVFLLVSGKAKLLYENASGQKTTARFPESVPFGFDFIAMGSAYPCTAVTESDVSVLFLPKSTLAGFA